MLNTYLLTFVLQLAKVKLLCHEKTIIFFPTIIYIISELHS